MKDRFPIIPGIFFSFARLARSATRYLFAVYKWHKLAQRDRIRLELGSGPKKGKNGWVTIDGGSGADILWDLRNGIPLEKETVEKIYSSHLMEHISYKELLEFLQECRRVLRVGGEFSVSVPNSRFYLEAYLQGKYFRPRDSWWSPASIDTGSLLDQVNYIAFMGGEHKHLFDSESLINILKKAGFSGVSSRAFEAGLDPAERDFESIYAVGFKD